MLTVSSSLLLLDFSKCLDVGNRIYNASHCMSGTRRARRKNITSGTRRAVSNTKRREVSFFFAHKRPGPFFLYIPHNNRRLNRQMINLLSLAYAEYVGFFPVVQLFAPLTNPAMFVAPKIPFINWQKKLLLVSAICAQILGFSRVRVELKVSVRDMV